MKEYAEFLALPVTDVINRSFKEQKLPRTWKRADISYHLPMAKQITDPTKELRPISLTSSASKIADDFVVSDYIRPVLEKKVD